MGSDNVFPNHSPSFTGAGLFKIPNFQNSYFLFSFLDLHSFDDRVVGISPFPICMDATLNIAPVNLQFVLRCGHNQEPKNTKVC